MNDAPSGNLAVSKTEADIFGSEAGMVKALAALRQSTLPLEEKNAARDLFLSYAGESDETKRNEIKLSITDYLKKDPGLSNLLPKTTETKPDVVEAAPASGGFGQARPVPKFSVAAVPPPTPDPTPATKAEEPVPPLPLAEPAPAPTSTAVDPKGRINDIKHDINSRVGNPVNLINADEKVGREYMSALLDAMKKAGQGGGETMARLEAAYQAALKVIKDKGLGTEKAAPVETPMEPEPAPALVPKVPEPEPTPVAETAPIIPPPPPPVQSHGLYHRPTDELEAEESTSSKPSGLGALTSRLFRSDAPVTPSPTPKTTVTTAPSVRKVSVAASEAPAAPVPEEKLKPLTETSNTLPEQMAAVKEKALEKEALAKKPITDLKSPEVEAGLRHLLSEWSLFKKSGFFGTGPSGIDHPLYQKLSSLPMAAVVSGRFEGSTPEIKRGLSDYMTGWRYEQGIVHEMGETFDTYLRRVIRQILEKQRKLKEKE